MSQLAGGELPHCRGVEGVGTGAHLDPRADLFTVFLIGHADHLDVVDVGMGVQELLDLARVDVLTTADDHVLMRPTIWQ